MRNEERRPGQGAAPEVSTAPRRDVHQRNPLSASTDTATRYRFGRGTLDELMNPDCSLCHRPHRHVIPACAEGKVFERRPRCRPWRRYTLTVVHEVPLPGSLRVPERQRREAA